MKKQVKINSKAIAESCKKAYEYRANAIVINKRAQLIMSLMASCFLLFCLATNAQKFENINGLGKSSTEVSRMKTVVEECMPFNSNHYKNGDLFVSYLNPDYGMIIFIFNKANICKKIMIYSKPSRQPDINKNLYDVNIVQDADKIVYIIQNK